MKLGRTILAILVALSVAMLPIAVVAAPSLKPVEISVHQAACDCCDHDAIPCQNNSDGCVWMATCVPISFGFSTASSTVLNALLQPAELVFSPPSNALRSHAGSLLFRPPRV